MNKISTTKRAHVESEHAHLLLRYAIATSPPIATKNPSVKNDTLAAASAATMMMPPAMLTHTIKDS